MILAILQARTSSSRLPGKVMLPLAGAPMLARHIERVNRSALIDRLIVATSNRKDDDRIAELAASLGVESFRGSLNNVLDRFYEAARPHRPERIVRLTGDCPLADWNVIDGCIELACEGDYDYASNALIRTWPDGLDVEVLTFAALESAWREASDPNEIEHVTPFINHHPERFRIGHYVNDADWSDLRWTVDEPADYEFVRRIYDRLYGTKPAFTTQDVLALLASDPELGKACRPNIMGASE